MKCRNEKPLIGYGLEMFFYLIFEQPVDVASGVFTFMHSSKPEFGKVIMQTLHSCTHLYGSSIRVSIPDIFNLITNESKSWRRFDAYNANYRK